MRRHRSIIAAACAAALAVTGCTVDDPSGSADAGSGSIEVIDGLEETTITVGSKEFGEQLILGQIAILTLQAAGAETADETNITGSDNVRKALTSGEIDVYWEYTGTAWVSYLKQDEQIADPGELYDKVKGLDAENGITWWAPSPANNTYAIAANQSVVDEHGVETLTDYTELVSADPEAAAICMGPEFSGRDDGFPGLAGAYGFELPAANQHEVNDAIVYTEAGKGETCNFGSVAATDGRIAANDLVVLEDDQSFFPVYNPAITIDSELAEQFPELEQVFAAVASKLTDDVLLDLNQRVDVNAEKPAKVAEQWMTEQGFIG